MIKFLFLYETLFKITMLSNFSINPWTITGYVEAEGNFSISVYKYGSNVTRAITFNIHVHAEDIIFLTLIKNYFNCGTICSVDKFGHVTYTVKKKMISLILLFLFLLSIHYRVLNIYSFICSSS
jgi:hypothetical protein